MSARPIQFLPALRPRAVAHAATAVVSAALGWFAHGPVVPPPGPAAEQRCASVAAPIASPAHAAPLIAVSSDGNVTLRVEQQPLQWVLEQIAIQGGWPDLERRACTAAERAAPAASTAAPAAPVMAAAPALASFPQSAAAQVDAVRVLQSIESGTEAERFQGLMLARSADIAVAEPTLKFLYETGASERLQVAAFEAYLALHADRPDALRAALESAQYAPTAVIQREAGQRLAQLREVQRLNALPPLADP
jgi:hypothetical protein